MLEKPEYQCKTGTEHSSENRIDPNQLISYAKICYYHMRAFACICMHTQHWHYFISVFLFLSIFFLKILLFLDIRYTICLDPIKIRLSCLIWIHFVWMSPITSRNHTAWGPIRRVGLLVNLFDKDKDTEDPNQVTEFCGVLFRSAIFGFLKVKIISRFWLWYNILGNNGASLIIIIYITKLMPYFHNS